MRQRIELVGERLDRYGCRLSQFTLDRKDMHATLVAEGLAWHYTRYDRDPGLQQAERHAREAHLGLWRDPGLVPPWRWRAREKARKVGQGEPATQ